MIRRLWFAAFFVLGVVPPASALDPAPRTPYQLQVVLRIAEHRLLTPVFKGQVERELHDSLQSALGDLGQVSVVHQHPRLAEVEVKGLKTLDGWQWVEDLKLHFVFVDFVNGRYAITSRQYDGLTGLASPVIRHEQTADRLLVARTAALLVARDFGMVGTLGPITSDKPDAGKVDVVLKGGELVPDLSPWVKKGDVLAIAQIVSTGSGARAFRMPWTLLEAQEEPQNGVVPCKLYFRRKDPLPQAGNVLGYRCLRLETIEAPVRLRLVEDNKFGTPLTGQSIQIGAKGFDGPVLERRSPDADGVVRSGLKYKGIAFVSVFENGEPVARLPIELVEDRTISCPVSINKEMDRRGQLETRRDRWISRLNDALDASAAVFRDLKSSDDGAREQALAKAQAGLKGLQADLATLGEEQANLQREAQELKTKLELGDGPQRLLELQSRREQLDSYIASINDIVLKEKDPKVKKWKEMAEQARLLEGQADFEGAIQLYKRVLSDGGDDPRLRKHLTQLEDGWKIKSEDHRKARAFIYEVWPRYETAAQMKANLKHAQDAFDTCRKSDDTLTPVMLRKTNVAHTSKLAREVDSLRDTDDDRRTAQDIIALTDGLGKLNKDIDDFLRLSKPAK